MYLLFVFTEHEQVQLATGIEKPKQSSRGFPGCVPLGEFWCPGYFVSFIIWKKCDLLRVVKTPGPTVELAAGPKALSRTRTVEEKSS